MIHSIKIQNIQSHKDTELKLSPGINAIIGSSNNGKSAILRALYWVVYNRPLGTDNLLSHWAIDEKGNQIEPMEVTVENDDGFVIRRRTKTKNQYIVNDEELNVVKTDVPLQVEKLLRLTDTNIQRQQDAPFLLSLSSGQVAQYFNKTVRLDIIDKILSNAESKRRKTNQEIAQNEDLLKEYSEKREKYTWMDEVEKLLSKYNNISEKHSSIEIEFNELNADIELYEKYSELVVKYRSLSKVKVSINKFELLNEQTQKLKNDILSVEESLEDFDACKLYPSFETEKKLIQKFNDLNSEVDEKDKCINSLEEEINGYLELTNNIKLCEQKIKESKAQLPDVCPLCGAAMKDGRCVNE